MTSAPPKSISRLPLLPEPPTDPIAAEMFKTIESHGRSILNIHRMEVHSPKFFSAQARFAGALRNDTVLSRALSELIIVRTAMQQNCPYVFSVHTRMARDCGVSKCAAGCAENLADQQPVRFTRGEAGGAGLYRSDGDRRQVGRRSGVCAGIRDLQPPGDTGNRHVVRVLHRQLSTREGPGSGSGGRIIFRLKDWRLLKS